jgi:hypothetical protein
MENQKLFLYTYPEPAAVGSVMLGTAIKVPDQSTYGQIGYGIKINLLIVENMDSYLEYLKSYSKLITIIQITKF